MKRRPLLRRVRDAFTLGALAFKRPLRVSARSAYDGAGQNRLLLDWSATSRTADAEIRGDLRKLRARARELARNNSYIRRYLKLLSANVLGPGGINLQALIRDAAGQLDADVNRKIEDAWNEWATGPVSLDGRMSLRRFEDLVLRTLATDGEAFVRVWKGADTNRFGIALQAIDADLIDERFNRNPRPGVNEIRLGVEVDTVGRPVAYHVWNSPAGAMSVVPRARYVVPASEMFHLYAPDRINQTRGVTWLHSIMVPAHMLDGYEESEAVASRVSSAKMGFMVKTAPEAGGNLSVEGDGGTTPAHIQAAPGSFEILDDGYDFKPWDPAHPTSQFGAFIKQMVRKIASGLSVFSNVLANDAEGVSYSSMRSFALIERDDWRQIQEDWVDMFRRPLYADFLSLALLTGALRLPSRNPAGYMAVKHQARGWSWIDPEKEAKAAGLAIGLGLTSRTALLAEKGIDIDDVFAELKAENESAAKYGITIEASAPAPEPATKDDVEALAEDRGNGDGREVVARSEDGARVPLADLRGVAAD